MAHFYGTIQGARGEASRLGNKSSGLHTVAASWKGAVEVELFEKDGEDYYRVSLRPWHGCGQSRLIEEGRLGP